MDVANKVGVRTRAEVQDLEKDRPGQSKRRKVGGREVALSSSSLTHELNNLCKYQQAFNSQGDAIAARNESLYSNFSSDGGESCCSSNGSDEASTNKLATDLVENVANEALSSTRSNSGESGGTTPLNRQTRETLLQPESTSSETSCRRQVKTEKLMPSEAELEEFFAVAENKNLQKQFADKYNYDIFKDEPLGGRYEWVPLMP